MPRVSRLLLCAASHFLAGRGGAAGAAGEKNFRDVRIQAVVCAVSPPGRELVLAYDSGPEVVRHKLHELRFGGDLFPSPILSLQQSVMLP